MNNTHKIWLLNCSCTGLGLVVPFTLLMVVLLVLTSSMATAQRGNQSDWNVPPPLAPGATTKGDTQGKPGNSSGIAVLSIADVTAVIQPAASPPIPELAAVGTAAPEAGQPEQPASETVAALADTPLPEMPETPDMPARVLQDAPEPPRSAVPVPVVPELPAPPRAPASLTGAPQPTKGLPLMPDVAPSAQLITPPLESVLWNTPGIPESLNFKLIIN